jgi:hypothetical protein
VVRGFGKLYATVLTVPDFVALKTFSPSGEPSFYFSAFTSVPSSDGLTWAVNLPVFIS